jgi:hypothetical protein
MEGCRIDQLISSREALLTMIQAIREGYRVLQELGIPVTPASHRVFKWLPLAFLQWVIRKSLSEPTARLKIGHVEAAVEEMRFLADQLRELKTQTSIVTPELDRLCSHIAAAANS